MIDKYLPRIIDDSLKLSLATSTAVLFVGPKWCGKTRSAEEIAASVLYMQDPDYTEEHMLLARAKLSKLLEGAVPRLIDEWQMAPVLWNAVRFAVDERRARGQFILTGSVVSPLEKDMHSGTGRISRLRMHTMSLFESNESTGEIALKDLFAGKVGMFSESPITIERLAFILARGGWPEAIGVENEQYALRTVYTYVDSVVHQDMSQIDGMQRNPDRVYALLRSIARNVSTQANTQTLVNDLQSNNEDIGEKTINEYLNAMKSLYVLEDLPAWSPHLRSKRSIRKTAKRHFTDPSIATAALRANGARILHDIKTFGSLFESLCIRDLRIYAESLDGSLYHYRDQLGVEVDAIIQLRDERWAAVEIKLGAGEIEQAAQNLLSFSQNIDTDRTPPPFVSHGHDRYQIRIPNGQWGMGGSYWMPEKLRRLLALPKDLKAQYLLHGIKVPIAVQESVAMGNTEGGDQDGDGVTHCYPVLSECSIVPCRLDGDLFTDQVMVFERLHELSAFCKVLGTPEALKKLGDDQQSFEKEYVPLYPFLLIRQSVRR